MPSDFTSGHSLKGNELPTSEIQVTVRICIILQYFIFKWTLDYFVAESWGNHVDNFTSWFRRLARNGYPRDSTRRQQRAVSPRSDQRCPTGGWIQSLHPFVKGTHFILVFSLFRTAAAGWKEVDSIIKHTVGPWDFGIKLYLGYNSKLLTTYQKRFYCC